MLVRSDDVDQPDSHIVPGVAGSSVAILLQMASHFLQSHIIEDRMVLSKYSIGQSKVL